MSLDWRGKSARDVTVGRVGWGHRVKAVSPPWAMQARYGAAAQEVVETALRATERASDEALRTMLVRAILNVLDDRMYQLIRKVFMKTESTCEGPVLKAVRLEFEQRGEARGRAAALLNVLTVRGFALGDELRERVMACADVALLDQWLARAVMAPTLDAVFIDDP